eukprot:617800-Amphidinium_carterae.1
MDLGCQESVTSPAVSGVSFLSVLRTSLWVPAQLIQAPRQVSSLVRLTLITKVFIWPSWMTAHCARKVGLGPARW